MVLFGELIIPTSRVLWDDEDEIIQVDSKQSPLEWQGNCSVPNDISNILIGDTIKLSYLFKTCLSKNQEPICYLNDPKVAIYNLKKNDYLIICEENDKLIPGKITDKLIPWIKNAKHVICVTSKCAATFYNKLTDELSECVIRSIYTNTAPSMYAKHLAAPNLITGVTAGVMSYCQHIKKSAASYICYIDSKGLDSATSKPILELLKNINVSTSRPFTFKSVFQEDSNLYM